MKTRSLYLLTALVGALAFTVPWLTRIAAQDSPIGSYSMSEWAHYQLNVNRVLETGQVGKVIGYVSNGVVGVVSAGQVPEAPLGTLLYARSNALWQAFPPGLATMQTDAPDNGLWYSRRNGEWQNFLPGGGAGTNVGGTNRLKLAALAEFRPPNTNGTLLPSNTATFIRVNHIFDPDGVITAINTNTGSFRPAAGYYAITMVVPVSVAETGGGNVRIPFTIALFDLTTTNDVYFQTYTVYDEDLSQYNQVFLPALVTDGTHDFTIRVFNHSTTLDLVAGQAGNVAGLENHYTEIQFLKIDGIAGLPEAPINSSLYARSNEDWLSFTIPSTNGFIPEAPTDGQTYGRRGSDASWHVAAGGGADTNAVASVSDLVTLSNLTGYVTAIVGGTNAAPSLWQYGPIATLFDGADWNNLYGSSSQTLTLESDGSTTARSSTIGYMGADWSSPFNDKRVTLYYPAVASSSSQANYTTTANQLDPIEYADFTLSTTKKIFHRSFTAIDATSFYCIATGTATDTFNFGPVWYAEGDWPVMPIPNGTNIVGSPLNGFGWKKVGDIYPDALSDGQTYGRKDGAWAVVTGGAAQATTTFALTTDLWNSTIPAFSGTLILDTEQVLTGTIVQLVGQPTFTDGTFIGQTMTVLLPDSSTSAITGVVLMGNGNPSYPLTDLEFTDGLLYLRMTRGGRNAVQFVWDGEYWYQNWGPLATSTPSTEEEATLLPAPWGPPDTDGNQTIRDDVQDALIDALLPRLLQRLGPSTGTLPTPAPAPRRMGKPGTRANPIDWPAAPEPAAAAGKYHININIGDQ